MSAVDQLLNPTNALLVVTGRCLLLQSHERSQKLLACWERTHTECVVGFRSHGQRRSVAGQQCPQLVYSAFGRHGRIHYSQSVDPDPCRTCSILMNERHSLFSGIKWELRQEWHLVPFQSGSLNQTGSPVPLVDYDGFSNGFQPDVRNDTLPCTTPHESTTPTFFYPYIPAIFIVTTTLCDGCCGLIMWPCGSSLSTCFVLHRIQVKSEYKSTPQNWVQLSCFWIFFGGGAIFQWRTLSHETIDHFKNNFSSQ